MKTGKQNILLLICFTISLNLTSQEIKPDSLWKAAQQQSASSDFVSAVLTLQILTKEFPYNNDYKLFLGRIFTWQGNYKFAVDIITPVVQADSLYGEAYEALVNALLGAEDYNQVVMYCDLALLKIDDSSTFFTLKKATALIKLGQNKEAMVVLQKVLSADQNNKEALALRTLIFQSKINTLSVSYENTSYSGIGLMPRHLSFIEFKRSSPKFTGILRMNYIKMIGQSEPQFEIDLYPKLSKSSYLYISLGMAEGSNVLPLFKGNFELYKTFNKVELSVGGRIMDFTTKQVKMLTGQINVAIKTWEIGYRPLFVTIEKGWYTSHSIQLKKSNEVKERTFQMNIYSGSPYKIFDLGEFTQVNTLGFGLQYQFRVSSSTFLRPVFTYEREEYFPGLFRNRFCTQLIFSKRFY
ncbi:MAG: YaiO family outer membrane beta-barrel protein [Chitinophagaceae bacterium]|nr:MAG: YaiO family outer membrane beta-barrel protein [Chitinophagaceae bacterium]